MKTLHFTTQHASDSIYMPITVWGIGGFWTMEDNAMACEPLVQPSKDGNELLKRQVQTRCSTPTSTQHCKWSCMVHHGHADKMAVIPLFSLLVPYTHNCHSSMSCTCHNVTVWQTCLLETNHSAPFEWTHLLILRWWGIPALASMFQLCLEALHWLNKA